MSFKTISDIKNQYLEMIKSIRVLYTQNKFPEYHEYCNSRSTKKYGSDKSNQNRQKKEIEGRRRRNKQKIEIENIYRGEFRDHNRIQCISESLTQ